MLRDSWFYSPATVGKFSYYRFATEADDYLPTPGESEEPSAGNSSLWLLATMYDFSDAKVGVCICSTTLSFPALPAVLVGLLRTSGLLSFEAPAVCLFHPPRPLPQVVLSEPADACGPLSVALPAVSGTANIVLVRKSFDDACNGNLALLNAIESGADGGEMPVQESSTNGFASICYDGVHLDRHFSHCLLP